MFKKTEHTDLCIKTTDGAELWNSAYMLGVHSQLLPRHVVARSIRMDETRIVAENLLNLVEGRVAPLSDISYRTLRLATTWGFYEAADTLRKKIIATPSLEFLRAERESDEYKRALRRYMISPGNSNSGDIIGDMVREYGELFETLEQIRAHFKKNAPASALRLLEAHHKKYRG